MAGPKVEHFATRTALKASSMMAQEELSASSAATSTHSLEVSAGKDGDPTFH